MNNWIKLKVEDVCDFIGGSQPPKTEFIDHYKPGYIRLVQTRDFKTDKFPTYIPEGSTTKLFRKEDIVIGRYGPPIFQIFRGMEGAYNVALIKAVPKNNIINEFLYYFLRQNTVFEYVEKLSSRTGGQTGVDLISLYKYPINLPEKTEQIKISGVLSALDSKIELNNHINSELEAMAKMLYDYWFVQFDFPDKNNKPYKTSGGKMVWNNELKREIPEGWEVKPLSEITDVSNESLNPMDFPDKEFNYYSIPGFDETGTFKIEKGFEIKSNKYSIKKTDVLVSKLNPWFSRVIYATDDMDLISSTEFVVWRTESTAIKNYLYMIARDASFVTFCTKSASGTSNSHKRVNPAVMMNYQIVFDNAIAKMFGNTLGSSIKMLAKNKIENQKLTELRDWLLPMLMNRQVKVN